MPRLKVPKCFAGDVMVMVGARDGNIDFFVCFLFFGCVVVVVARGYGGWSLVEQDLSGTYIRRVQY
jgi:hypothetical protein